MSASEKDTKGQGTLKGTPSDPPYGQAVMSSDGMPTDGQVGQSNDPLQELNQRLAVVRDRVRGVARGYCHGLYLFGRPGTSKTHTVIKTLKDDGVGHYHQLGHLTPIGLFELLEEQHDRVVVLDDVSHIFSDKKALQILLAALGTQRDGQRARIVRYRRQGYVAEIRFTGGLVCISNLHLDQSPLLEAVKSRVHYIKHDPSDEQIAALMLCVAAQGWPAGQPELTPAECREVAEFLIAESRKRDARLDMRLLVDKAFPDYLQWRAGDTEVHWKDLVRATMEERLVELQYTSAESMSRHGRKQVEHQVVRQITETYRTTADRLAEWKARTGKSERAFYRRLREIA